MSTDYQAYESPMQEEAAFQYRALSATAVTALLFGLLSPLAFFSIYLGLIPMLAVVIGLFALAQIRSRPQELTGRRPSWIGISIAVLCLTVSWSWEGYVYATEVPEGYRRVLYSQLQPDLGQDYPPLAKQLDGEKVFVKGYVMPGAQKAGIKKFLLVPDKGDCCFGGNPALTKRIQVTLGGDRRLKWSLDVVKVTGVFRFQPSTDAVTIGGEVSYHVDEAEFTR